MRFSGGAQTEDSNHKKKKLTVKGLYERLWVLLNFWSNCCRCGGSWFSKRVVSLYLTQTTETPNYMIMYVHRTYMNYNFINHKFHIQYKVHFKLCVYQYDMSLVRWNIILLDAAIQVGTVTLAKLGLLSILPGIAGWPSLHP